MITDEGQLYAARVMKEAADKAAYAAGVMEEAARRIAVLLEDGYGGNGVRLIELLEKQPTEPVEPTTAEKCGSI